MAERAAAARKAASKAGTKATATPRKTGTKGTTRPAPVAADKTPAGDLEKTAAAGAQDKTAAKAAPRTAAARTAAARTSAPKTTAPVKSPENTAKKPEKVSNGTKATSARRGAPIETKADQAPPSAAPQAVEGVTMGKSETRTTSTRATATAAEAKATKVAPKTTRSAAETEKIRVALAARLDELKDEYEATISEITELQRDRLTDSAGDDQADTGTKTFEREQEISLANTILERVTQVERALERLDEGVYGWCERCGNPIPVERLAAFPSATLCVTCKQLEERR